MGKIGKIFSGLLNGRIRGLQIGAREITTWGSFSDFKSGEKITNRGRDFKSGQRDFKLDPASYPSNYPFNSTNAEQDAALPG